MDESAAFTRADIALLVASMKEVLWGGERGPGLTFLVAEQQRQLTSLSTLFAEIAKDVNGADGVRVELREIRVTLTRLVSVEQRMNDVERAAFQKIDMQPLEQKAQREHERLDERIDRIEERLEGGPVPGWIFTALALIISTISVIYEISVHGVIKP